MNEQNEFLSASALRGISSPSALTLMTALTAAALCPDFYAQEAQPAPASAASANSGTNAPTALPEVVVTGTQESGYKPEAVSSPKIVTPLRDTPQTINVVPRQVIEEQNATTLRDVLRNVPGISFQAGEGGVPAGDQMSIRGFSARTDLFVDGVRDVGGYTRDSFNTEQVEVFKGPNSAYSGRGSTGGAVNLVSKTPKLNPIYGATLSYGSSDYYRGTFDMNQPLPELEKIGVTGAAFRFDGLYHDQDFAGRDFVHDNRWALNPTFAIGLGTNTRLTLSYLHLQEDNLAGYGLPFVSSSNNPFGGASAVGKVAPLPYQSFLGLRDRDFEKIANDIGGVRFEHDFTEDVSLLNNMRYARTDRDSIITAPRIIRNPLNDPAYPPYTAANGDVVVGSDGALYGLNHELQSRDQTTDIFSNQTDFKMKFDTGTLEHTLLTSFEYAHEVEENYQRSATIGTPFTYPAELSNPLDPSSADPFHPYRRTGLRNQAIADSTGLSTFDTVKITDQWIFTAGLRGDFVTSTFHQRGTNGLVSSLERTDMEPTWRAGVVYKPVPIGSIFFGYGTSFNPSIENQSLNTAAAPAAGLAPLLDPEFGTSYELGTKWDLLKERLSISGALFRTEKSNFRNTDPVTLITSTTGEVYVQGFELGVSGKVTDKWNVYGGYAFMVSEITKSAAATTYNGSALPIPEQGHRLSNTPEQTASISSTYELPYKLQIGTSFFFVDKRYSNNIETQSAPGYWLEDAFISWKASKHVDIRLNVSNLWDDEYIDRVGGGHAIPGAGRTVILTTSFNY